MPDTAVESMGDNLQPILTKVLTHTIEKHIPFNVIFELTYRCNLRCKHCYIPEPSRHQRELTTEECYQVLDDLAELKGFYITYTGGEIFLRPDFFKIASYGKSLGFAQKFFTNGTLLTPMLCDRIAEAKPVSVEISIYGVNDATHDFVTKARGSHRKSMEGIRWLVERGVRTKAKMPLMYHSFDEFKELLAECESMGVELSMDHSIAPMDDGTTDVLGLRITNEQLYRIFTDKTLMPKGDLPSAPAQICEAGRNTASISPLGDVFPCLQLPLKAGNVREKSLKDIWNESDVMRELRGLQTHDLKQCPTCSLQAYCNRCAGMALLEDGDYLGCSSRARQVATIRQMIALERQGRNADLPVANFPVAPPVRANTAVPGTGGLMQIARPWKPAGDTAQKNS
jgi:radical SAM protein with 4Fe4S-binding SPASM domain